MSVIFILSLLGFSSALVDISSSTSQDDSWENLSAKQAARKLINNLKGKDNTEDWLRSDDEFSYEDTSMFSARDEINKEKDKKNELYVGAVKVVTSGFLFEKYASERKDGVEHQDDHEYGQFLKFLAMLTVNSYPYTSRRMAKVRIPAPNNTAIIESMFNHTLDWSAKDFSTPTSKKLKVVTDAVSEVLLKLCPYHMMLIDLLGRRLDVQAEIVARWIKKNENSDSIAAAHVSTLELVNLIDDQKLHDHLKKNVGKVLWNRYALANREKIKEVVERILRIATRLISVEASDSNCKVASFEHLSRF